MSLIPVLFASLVSFFPSNEGELTPVSLEGLKKATVGIHWIPHIVANEDFTSSILVRSDEINDQRLRVDIFFIQPNGEDAMVTYTDGNVTETVHRWMAFIPAQGATQIEILGIEHARSCQAIIFAIPDPLENVFGSDRIAFETTYRRIFDDRVTGIVGNVSQKPTVGFKMNLDYTGETGSKIRGLAIMNTKLDDECNCLGLLLDGVGDLASQSAFSIPDKSKWLGLVTDMVPGAPDALQGGVGSLFVVCDQEISVLGLSFEGNAIGSAPITRFQ